MIVVLDKTGIPGEPMALLPMAPFLPAFWTEDLELVLASQTQNLTPYKPFRRGAAPISHLAADP